MLIDPVQYWQELTENYRQMGDEELRELAANPEDLTEVARQVLRDEMRKRGLDERPSVRLIPTFSTPKLPRDRRTVAHFTPNEEPSQIAEVDDATEIPHEYTWKVLLCECETRAQAWQVSQVLLQAGIESWIEAPKQYYVDPSNPCVMVAADQLEQARTIAAQPIPQDLIEESEVEVPEFVPPVCPKCGAADPVLTGADPVNAWLCEACGAEWSEAEVEPAGREGPSKIKGPYVEPG
jgi:hypothetical protein